MRRGLQAADIVRLVLVVDLDALQAVDDSFFQMSRTNGFLGDLAQSDDRIFIAIAIDGQIRAARNLTGPLRREQHQIETVGNLVDAILDGDARHACVLRK